MNNPAQGAQKQTGPMENGLSQDMYKFGSNNRLNTGRPMAGQGGSLPSNSYPKGLMNVMPSNSIPSGSNINSKLLGKTFDLGLRLKFKHRHTKRNSSIQQS